MKRNHYYDEDDDQNLNPYAAVRQPVVLPDKLDSGDFVLATLLAVGTMIVEPKDAAPYPRKADATNDKPTSDSGGNFGRIARTGLMDEYLERMMIQPVCGIKATYWLEFFKIFHQDATDEQIRKALDRLRSKVECVAESTQKQSLMEVLSALEVHFLKLY